MRAWYIAFTKDNCTRMRILKERAHAIGVACDMLDSGIEVTRLGPMLITGEQDIDAASIREIWRDRTKH